MCRSKNYIEKSIDKWDRETCMMASLVNSETLNTAKSWLEIKLSAKRRIESAEPTPVRGIRSGWRARVSAFYVSWRREN